MEEHFGVYRESSVEFLQSLGVRQGWAVLIQSVVIIVAILVFAWLIDKLATMLMATMLMRKYVPKIVGRTKNKWDDIFMENRVFAQLAHFLPGIIMLLLYPFIASKVLRAFIQDLFATYFIIVALLCSC